MSAAEKDTALGPLSKAQIRQFREDGALVLRGFIGPETVTSWLEQWEAKTGAKCDDPSTWPGKTPEPEWRTEPKLTELPQVQALSDQLSGETGLITSYPFDGHMIPTWPAPQAAAWQPGTGAHLDNYGGNGWTGGLNHGFVITAYLQDIDERGGCFTYWPGSHFSVHEYFRANPTHIDGSFEHSGLDTWKRFWATEPHASRGGMAGKSKHTGVQFSGKRGDVVIWHGGLMHSGSMNCSDTPRLALFGSFRNAAMHMPHDGIKPPNFEPLDSDKRTTELRYSIPENLWKYCECTTTCRWFAPSLSSGALFMRAEKVLDACF